MRNLVLISWTVRGDFQPIPISFKMLVYVSSLAYICLFRLRPLSITYGFTKISLEKITSYIGKVILYRYSYMYTNSKYGMIWSEGDRIDHISRSPRCINHTRKCIYEIRQKILAANPTSKSNVHDALRCLIGLEVMFTTIIIGIILTTSLIWQMYKRSTVICKRKTFDFGRKWKRPW